MFRVVKNTTTKGANKKMRNINWDDMPMLEVQEEKNYTPQELRKSYINIYAATFDSTIEHAKEMFLSEYDKGHDFHTMDNVLSTIDEHAKFCGIQ